MINHIEALAEVEQAQQRYFTTVVGGKDAVRDGRQRGFRRMTGTEAVLTWGKEVIV